MNEEREAMLTAHEARILGCLMEKQMTTPDYYHSLSMAWSRAVIRRAVASR